MSATPVYAFAIPDSDVAVGFTNGEKALTVAANVNLVPPRTYWYLSKYVLLTGGNYTLKINGSDPFIFSIGSGLNTTRRVVSGQRTSGFALQQDFFVRGGKQRIDIQMFNVSLPDDPYEVDWHPSYSSCYVAFSLWKDGNLVYSSDAPGWLFDSSWVPDAQLTATADPRTALPVWTLSPNWKEGVLETVSFQTEIMVSEMDAEQRRSLARHPRRTVEASFLRAGVGAQRMNEFMVGVGSRKFMMPFWPEQMYLGGPVSAGDTEIYFEYGALDNREFYNGGAFVLTNRGTSTYELLTYTVWTDSDNHTLLRLDTPLVHSWDVHTRITPAYEARFDDSSGAVAMQYVTDRTATAQLRFNLVNTLKHVTPSWDYCAPLWRFPIDWTDTWSETFTRNTDKLDTTIGPIDVIDPSGVTRVGQSLKITLLGRDAVSKFRSFITMARGKTVRFWFPSNHNDITPIGPTIGGATLNGVDNGYTDWLVDPQDAKLMIQIEFASGAPTIYRRLQSVTKAGSQNIYHMDEVIPTFPTTDVSRISFVMPVRFDQDNFELNHVTDELAVVTASPAIMSAEIANMPPIECWITSRPYPVSSIESATMTSVITGGYMPFVIESASVSATVVSGSFPTEVVYGEYDAAQEDAATVTAQVVSGSMQTFTYGEYDAPAEDQASVSAIVVSGSFPQSLVGYSIPADSATMSSRVLSGTLS